MLNDLKDPNVRHQERQESVEKLQKEVQKARKAYERLSFIIALFFAFHLGIFLAKIFPYHALNFANTVTHILQNIKNTLWDAPF